MTRHTSRPSIRSDSNWTTHSCTQQLCALEEQDPAFTYPTTSSDIVDLVWNKGRIPLHWTERIHSKPLYMLCIYIQSPCIYSTPLYISPFDWLNFHCEKKWKNSMVVKINFHSGKYHFFSLCDTRKLSCLLRVHSFDWLAFAAAVPGKWRVPTFARVQLAFRGDSSYLIG